MPKKFIGSPEWDFSGIVFGLTLVPYLEFTDVIATCKMGEDFNDMIMVMTILTDLRDTHTSQLE